MQNIYVQLWCSVEKREQIHCIERESEREGERREGRKGGGREKGRKIGEEERGKKRRENGRKKRISGKHCIMTTHSIVLVDVHSTSVSPNVAIPVHRSTDQELM